MDMEQYLDIFIEESKEHLQNLNTHLLELEKDPNNSNALNEIFRVAHTLKGMSGTMGFGKMSVLTHDMENVLDALRSGKLQVTSDMIDLMFKCLDAIESYVNNVITTGSEGEEEYTDIIKALGELVSHSPDKKPLETKDMKSSSDISQEKKEAKDSDFRLKFNEYDFNVMRKALEAGLNVFEIHIELSEGCLLKAARAFIIFQVLDKYSEIIKAYPSVEDIEDEKFDFEFTVMVISKEKDSLLKKELNSVAEVKNITIKAMNIDLLESLEKVPSKDSKDKKALAGAASGKVPVGKSANKNTAVIKKAGKTVRVDIDRLDVLMNLVSELIIIKTRLDDKQILERENSFNEAIEYLERITTSLHDAVMKVRMVPVEMVFNRFPRMIRDIAKELNKEIELSMSGEKTELDRTVIDEIGDPLIHILRNSADHGLEKPEERERAGKSGKGNIYLRAYQDGNNVVIEVEDDGKGIDIERVREKIVEKELLTADAAKNLSKKDIIEYLFAPSFSTADKVTDLSGRGVGLDVVKTKIEALGGVVEVETEWGKGTKFIISLPLTLAIIQALLVKIGEEKYAIPLNSISEINTVSSGEIQMIRNQEVMLLRDKVIPIIRLDEILEVPKVSEEKDEFTVVIVRKGEKLAGFIVDTLIGQQEIVIKSLGKLLLGVKCIAGATILGDGNVALIIDVNTLV